MTEEDHENQAREMVRVMLGSWPNKEIEVAKALGISGKLLGFSRDYAREKRPLRGNL
jgi:hypothetical protein